MKSRRHLVLISFCSLLAQGFLVIKSCYSTVIEEHDKFANSKKRYSSPEEAIGFLKEHVENKIANKDELNECRRAFKQGIEKITAEMPLNEEGLSTADELEKLATHYFNIIQLNTYFGEILEGFKIPVNKVASYREKAREYIIPLLDIIKIEQEKFNSSSQIYKKAREFGLDHYLLFPTPTLIGGRWISSNGYWEPTNEKEEQVLKRISEDTPEAIPEVTWSEDKIAFAESLQSSYTKQKIAIYREKEANVSILAEGLKQLTEDLRQHQRTLKFLLLRTLSLEPEEIKEISSILEEMPVEVLDLSYNNIGDMGTESLANILRSNKSLAQLSLKSSNISNKGLEELASALEQNSHLRALDLSDNFISKKAQEEFCKKFARRPININLHDNKNPYEEEVDYLGNKLAINDSDAAIKLVELYRKAGAALKNYYSEEQIQEWHDKVGGILSSTSEPPISAKHKKLPTTTEFQQALSIVLD